LLEHRGEAGVARTVVIGIMQDRVIGYGRAEGTVRVEDDSFDIDFRESIGGHQIGADVFAVRGGTRIVPAMAADTTTARITGLNSISSCSVERKCAPESLQKAVDYCRTLVP
jgi:hypothetical protein